MKTFNKKILLILILVFAFAILGGCGKEEEEPINIATSEIENRNTVDNQKEVEENDFSESEVEEEKQWKTLHSGYDVPEKYLEFLGFDNSFNEWMHNDGTVEGIAEILGASYRLNASGKVVEGEYDPNGVMYTIRTRNNGIVDKYEKGYKITYEFPENSNFKLKWVYVFYTMENSEKLVTSIRFGNTPIERVVSEEGINNLYNKGLLTENTNDKMDARYVVNSDSELVNKLLQDMSSEELESIFQCNAVLEYVMVRSSENEEELPGYRVYYAYADGQGVLRINYSFEEPADISATGQFK